MVTIRKGRRVSAVPQALHEATRAAGGGRCRAMLGAALVAVSGMLATACGGGGSDGAATPTRTPTGTTTGHFAYVTNVDSNNISAYDIRSDGSLSPLAGSPFAAGSVPVEVVISPSGKFLYVGNEGKPPYTYSAGGNVSAYGINPTTGALTPVPGSPFAADGAPGQLAFSPSGAHLYVLNGSSNNITGFSVDVATGVLAPMGAPYPVGSNPQDIAVDPSGKFVLVANGLSDNLSVLAIEPASGALAAVPGSPVPAGAFPIHIQFAAGGKFVYVNNADSGNRSAYSFNASTGALTPLAGSPFATPNDNGYLTAGRIGDFLYQPLKNGVAVYSVDVATGVLALVPGSPFAAGADSSGVGIEPSGRYLYLTDFAGGTVNGYAIDPTTGALAPVPGSTFAAGMHPLFIATF